MIPEGTAAPDFELEDDRGETVSLFALRGKPVVLFFYPKDETRGCTVQVCGMRDSFPAFEGRAHVFGISVDDAAAHGSFRKNHALPFPLLVDPDCMVADASGVDRMEHSEYGTLYKRQTVVIGPDGVVEKTLDEVDPATHAGIVLQTLEAMA
jgi:thioredoxin-dependent peroxiredoxin